uniref:NADH dehydrogenase subunit 2 n=1 Tax=Porotermes planiceps TaxID=137007 RepID=UPI002551DF6A|nr:NADH dehydrogenase subunit 2 [Porotermes planiceps]UYX57316.1 NADH dehydrogenase subunit 2 [Porotermes planiceps]WHM51953.1 NADH dehydrogenase subunit 2 [Porotermes planiceps]
MPNNSTKTLLSITLVIGILISVSSNSWFGAWMGLEINLMSFIPMMLTHNNVYTTEASMKYFIVQALASSTLLFMMLMSSLSESIFSLEKNTFMSITIMTPLMMKSGVAPLHWWFPSVMEGLSWNNCILLMTVQKVAPLMLISYQMNINLISATFILASVVMGSIGGFNQTSLRKIMTYSSINHTGWMLAAMLVSESLWIIYITIYSMLTTTVVMIIKPFNISFINQVMMINEKMKLMKFMMFMSLLSLGGLPPFLGFLPKWMVIQFMMLNNMSFMITIMVIMSIVTLYYYLRMCYSSFMILHNEVKWGKKTFMSNKKNAYSMIMASMSTLGLVLCTTIFNIS